MLLRSHARSLVLAARDFHTDYFPEVGTHALLSDKITFANLGLLVVDEEQRFGVKQKEKIKGASANVDVLSLTATPEETAATAELSCLSYTFVWCVVL